MPLLLSMIVTSAWVCWLFYQLDKMRERKDAAYEERNRVVAALAWAALTMKGGKAWLSKHPPDPKWHKAWQTIVFIDLPGAGQLSWHLHDRDVPLFGFLSKGPNTWDGHTSEEKYKRIEMLTHWTMAS